MKKPIPSARIIAPDAYPQMVARAAAASFARRLRSSESAAKGAQAVTAKMAGLRTAIHDYVAALETAGRAGDHGAVLHAAHEIRGFAENAGLAAAGRIADGLGRYLGELQRSGAEADAAIVDLHIGAITRAAHAKDEATRMGEEVASELAALVARRLKDIKD
jgi:hypothetical protein